MADKIIQHEKLEAHVIEPYRFKVLGGYIVEKVPEFIAGFPSQTLGEEVIANEYTHVDMQKLLDKTDELSAYIAKLQSELVTKESEFASILEEKVKNEQEEAYTRGYQSAKEELETLLSEQKSRYAKSIQQLNILETSIHEKMFTLESELGEAAVLIAKEVIAQELSQESTSIALTLSKALIKELKDATKIELHLNPDDFDHIATQYKAYENIVVVADEAIALGGVVALSDKGNIDSSLEMRLKKAKYMIQEK